MNEPAAPPKPWATRIIDLLTPAVFFGTPLLYVFGRIYSEGYWTTIGFPASLMERAAEDYIYFGFVALVSGISIATPHVDSMFVWLAPVTSIVLMTALAFAIWVLGKLHAQIKPRVAAVFGQLRDFLSERRDGISAIGKASTILESVTGAVLIAMLACLVLLLPVFLAFSIGQARANKVHKSLEEGTGTRAEVKITSRNGAQGQIVDCTPEQCVVHTPEGYHIVARKDIEWLPVKLRSP